MFPSPYGVSFILIIIFKDAQWYRKKVYSFRLLTEYHSFLLKAKGVEVSHLNVDSSFRLLTEYHSFLLENTVLMKSSKKVCFRLLTEYHSFLF